MHVTARQHNIIVITTTVMEECKWHKFYDASELYKKMCGPRWKIPNRPINWCVFRSSVCSFRKRLFILEIEFPSARTVALAPCGRAASGFVQFIESTAVAEVLAVDGSILNYFRKHAPSEHSPYGVAPEVIDNYIKSCGERKQRLNRKPVVPMVLGRDPSVP